MLKRWDSLRRDLRGEVPEKTVDGLPARIGKYTVLREISRGGMARVVLAQDPDLDRPVAIKILLEEHINWSMIRRFHREADLAASLNHPNIIVIHDVGVSRDASGHPLHFIAMEYIDGNTLAEHKLDPPKAAELLATVCDAIDYAHRQGIIHRDLKPGNILIDGTGRPVVTDFGLAKSVEEGSFLTVHGSVLGTPQYMAPEQIRGETDRLDARTDVYALGVILYETVAGTLPFPDAETAPLFEKILHAEPPSIQPSAPYDLETIALKALGKNPRARFPSAGAMAEELRRFLQGEPLSIRRVGPVVRAMRRIRRHPATALAAAAVILLSGWKIFSFLKDTSLFQERRADAERAYAVGDWKKAQLECERALVLRPDGFLSQIVRECRQKLALEEVEKQHLVSEIRLREKMKPLEGIVEDLRRSFYIQGEDIPAKRLHVQDELERYTTLCEDSAFANFNPLWRALGIGWYFVGDANRSEQALRKAWELDTHDAGTAYTLGRIYLERSMAELMIDDGDSPQEQRARSQDYSRQALDYMQLPTQGWGGAGEIDRHLAETYRVLANEKTKDVRRACREGLDRFKGAGTEEYWILQAWTEPAGHSDHRISMCNKALSIKPHDARAYFIRGMVWCVKKDLSRATADFSACIDINPYFARAYYERANIHRRKGYLKQALADYDETVRLEPTFAQVYNNRGIARERSEDHPGAMADYGEAIRLHPNLPQPYLNRGILWRKQGDLQKAIQDFSTALEINPNLPLAHTHRGIAFIELERWVEAVADLELALTLAPPEYPHTKLIQQNLAIALQELKKK